MGAIASQITSLTLVYSTVYSGADQSKHQSSASLAFVWGIHRGPVNSPHKWPVTRKMFPFDDVIMTIPLDSPADITCITCGRTGTLHTYQWYHILPGTVRFVANRRWNYIHNIYWNIYPSINLQLVFHMLTNIQLFLQTNFNSGSSDQRKWAVHHFL